VSAAKQTLLAELQHLAALPDHASAEYVRNRAQAALDRAENVEAIRLLVERAVVEHCQGDDLYMATLLAARAITKAEGKSA
jgi:hypothetical protein